MFHIHKVFKFAECNFSKYIVRRQMSKFTNVSQAFLPWILQFQIYNIYKKTYFNKVGQCHEVQFSQLHRSMANVKNLRMFLHIFELALTFSEIKMLNFLPLKSRSRSRCAIFAIIPFDGKCQNLQMSPIHFCARPYRFRDITISNI